MKKVIVIVGPTSSGKTAWAIEIAKKNHGEVISADSRQVYRGLDLLSGKVTKEEMQGVPHHLLDVADTIEIFTASDFKETGTKALNDVHSRNMLPIIAGGTGFYIDALLGRISLADVPPNEELRAILEKKDLWELQDMLRAQDPERFETVDRQNPRRLIRAIEIANALGKNPQPSEKSPYDILWVGLELTQQELNGKIKARVDERIAAGMIEELKNLHHRGLSFERMEQLGLECRYIGRYLRGELSYEGMVALLTKEIQQYAKRQYTWFKNNKNIRWFHPTDTQKIESAVRIFLKK